MLISSHRRRILDLAGKSRLPVISIYSEFVEAGGLLSYGPRGADTYRRAAYLVSRILDGVRPSDLPVEQSSTFELVINLKDRQRPRPHDPAVAAAEGGPGHRVTRPEELDARSRRLRAVLVRHNAPELRLMHEWLDNWSGVGLIIAGMSHQGWDVQLTAYAARDWRATFFPVGIAHSVVGGSAWEPTPWRAVHRAAWEVLS